MDNMIVGGLNQFGHSRKEKYMPSSHFAANE